MGVGGSAPCPSSLYPREQASTHCRGGWVGPRVGLDGRIILSPPGFDPGPSSPQSVTILTELPSPRHYNTQSWKVRELLNEVPPLFSPSLSHTHTHTHTHTKHDSGQGMDIRVCRIGSAAVNTANAENIVENKNNLSTHMHTFVAYHHKLTTNYGHD